MPTSSFKSTSRKPTTTKSSEKFPSRRSKSVSAFSRTSQFQKRDNPLFWVDGLDEQQENDVPLSKFDPTFKGSCGGETTRGRPLVRNSGLSTRGYYRNYESEDQEIYMSELKRKSKISLNATRSLPLQKNRLAESTSNVSEVLKGRNTWSSQHPAFEISDDSASIKSGSRIPHLDVERSTSIDSGSVEKTINSALKEKISDLKVDNISTGGILEAVRTEVRRAISGMEHDLKSAILRSNSDINESSICSERAPELVDPDEVEFMWNIRGEYVKELEECEERTRKLRAELAVEEHRELELSEILSDIVPEPKTPQVQKSHPLRKASLERRKMSRRLEEEAMAYFDECVSISTFDDSDFSSLEDPPSTVVRFRNPANELTTVPGTPSRVSACLFDNQDVSRESLLIHCDESSSLPANSSCNNNLQTTTLNVKTKPHFSFISKSSDATTLEQDVKSYVKKFSKDTRRDSCEFQTISSGHQNTRDFTCPLSLEKFLLDRMNFRSRIESGSMLLCGGYSGCSTLPFSSAL